MNMVFTEDTLALRSLKLALDVGRTSLWPMKNLFVH